MIEANLFLPGKTSEPLALKPVNKKEIDTEKKEA